MQCAKAEDKSHGKLVEELLGLLDVAKNTEQVMNSIKRMHRAQIERMHIPRYLRNNSRVPAPFEFLMKWAGLLRVAT